MATLPRSICLAGSDGAGKTTQAERLVKHLRAKGVPVRVCTVWDMFDKAAVGAIPFASKRDIDGFLASLHPNGRAMFLHMAMREALDRALDDRDGAVIVLVGYWMKYNATERAYGADAALCDHLGEAFPVPSLALFLDLDPAEALGRKPVLSRYESGQKGADGFVQFQEKVNVETRALLQATGPWHVIDARPGVEAVEAAIARRVDAWLAAEGLA